MRLTLVTSTCVIAALVAPQHASAAQVKPYVRLDVGHTIAGQLKIKPASVVQQDLDYETSLLSSAALGADFNNGIRLELEAGHRANDLNQFDGTINRGNMVADTIMTNLFYDFLRGSPIRPYLGVGAGVAKVDVSTFHNTGAVNLSTGKTVPAYQAMIGVSMPLTTHLSLDAGYRYFATQNVEMTGLTPSGQSVKHDLRAAQSSSRIGLTYRFGGEAKAAPPTVTEAAPEPAAPQQVSLSDFETTASTDDIASVGKAQPSAPQTIAATKDKTYMVYFAFDRADLNRAAKTEVRAAADYAVAAHANRINVSGFADTSGSFAYNLKLSKRRALSVVNELVKDGVDPSLINYVYRGEGDPVVATRDGMPEPRNRRTQIDVRF